MSRSDNARKDFPNLGKFPLHFSEPWKISATFFRTLEKIARIFPNLGKNSAGLCGALFFVVGLRAEGVEYTNTIARMTAWMTNAMAEQQVVGASIALVDDQKIVWSQGFGYADLEAGRPVATATVFRIGSVSKVFTAAGAMQLVEKGRLDLDAPFTNYIPTASWLPRYTNPPPITTRHLLDHHSGLPGDIFRGGFTTRSFDGGYAWNTNSLAQTYPSYPPEYNYAYGNLGFVLMQGVIEGADGGGRPFDRILDEDLFAPLGMEATSFVKDKAAIGNELAAPYIQGARMPEEYVNIYGTGSMYSRPNDMARFISMLFAGGQTNVLGAGSIEEMARWQTSNVVFDTVQSLRCGLGWDSVSDPALEYAGPCWEKNGATLVYSAMMMLLPGHKLGVAVVCSSVADLPNQAAPETLRQALLEKSGPHWPTNAVAFPSATQSVSQAELDALAGVYVGGSGYDVVTAGSGRLHYARGLGTASASSFSNLLLRTNGWFGSDAQPGVILCFTNLQGRDTALYRMSAGYYELQGILSERFEPAALSAAWSNRAGRSWYVRNEHPRSYLPVVGLTAPIALRQTNGILLVDGAYSGIKVLAPSNDTAAFVVGLNNRGDSSLRVYLEGTNECIIHAGYHFGPPPQSLGVQTDLAGDIPSDGEARWFEIAPENPAVAVGGVSNVWYEIALTGAPSNFLLRVYRNDGVTPVAERTGNGALEIASGASPLLLNLQPDSDGVQTGAYQVAFSVPLLVREISVRPAGIEQVWQGPTGVVYTLESADCLASYDTFAPLIEDIPAAGLLNSRASPLAPDSQRFYRVLQQAANHLGRKDP